MKPLFKTLLLLLLPCVSFCQTINWPFVGTSADRSLKIISIETNDSYTIVSFKNIIAAKGGWVELCKSIYIQDANGDDIYHFVKAEGITIKPEKHYAKADSEVVDFKVYFEKLKPEVTEINIIERAVSLKDMVIGNNSYFNMYNVSLKRSAPNNGLSNNAAYQNPALFSSGISTKLDTAYSSNSYANSIKNSMATIQSSLGDLYTNMIRSQIKFYSKPENIADVAKITHGYYEALIKAGFSADQAMKIVISKPLMSTEPGTK